MLINTLNTGSFCLCCSIDRDTFWLYTTVVPPSSVTVVLSSLIAWPGASVPSIQEIIIDCLMSAISYSSLR